MKSRNLCKKKRAQSRSISGRRSSLDWEQDFTQIGGLNRKIGIVAAVRRGIRMVEPMGKLGAGLRFLKKLYGRLEAHNISGLSAQLSYFFFLSLFPLLMAVFSLLPFLPVSEEDILYFLEDFAPEETIAVLESAVERILADHNGKILSISILITLWSASNGMNAIIRAMNLAYEVKENRPFFITRGISVLLTAAMIFVILVALALPVFGKQLGIYLFSKFGLTGDFLSAWHSFRWGVSSIVLFIVFTFLYYFTPNKRISCVSAIPGALVSTAGWMVSSLAFSYYVDRFAHYSYTYGSLGGIIVLLLWLYITAYILIIGGEVNAMISEKDREDGRC